MASNSSQREKSYTPPKEMVPVVDDPPGRWSALARLAVGMVQA